MLKSELIKLLNDIPGDAVMAMRIPSGKGFIRAKGVYGKKVKVREGKISNGMQNRLEYCGDVEGSFDIIVLEEI
jgi:hypothetical protein